MEREEATCCLDMSMHLEHPRRVLTALRCLLTEPKPRERKGRDHEAGIRRD